MAKECTYAGNSYSDGSRVCQAGEIHRCDDGSWTNLHEKCSESATITELSTSRPLQCKLDEKYIEAHSDVHTVDSWARALISEILKQAKAKLSTHGGVDAVSVDLKATVTPVASRSCLNICVGNDLCLHIPLN
jgi:hypothetical protein